MDKAILLNKLKGLCDVLLTPDIKDIANERMLTYRNLVRAAGTLAGLEVFNGRLSSNREEGDFFVNILQEACASCNTYLFSHLSSHVHKGFHNFWFIYLSV